MPDGMTGKQYSATGVPGYFKYPRMPRVFVGNT